MEDELLTVAEAAPLFRWRPSTLYEKVANGEVPYIKLPGGKHRPAIRFTRKLIQDYLRKCVFTPKAA